MDNFKETVFFRHIRTDAYVNSQRLAACKILGQLKPDSTPAKKWRSGHGISFLTKKLYTVDYLLP